MGKNKDRYLAANACPVMNLDAYVEWVRKLIDGDMETFTAITKNNADIFRAWFGKAAFVWIDSDRRKNWTWAFDLEGDFEIYVFSGERGTGYEIAAKNGDWAEAGKAAVSFIKETILPVVKGASG